MTEWRIKTKARVRNWVIRGLGFVSDFVLRIWNLHPLLPRARLNRNGRPSPRLAPEVEIGADLGGPLAHPDQPVVARRRRRWPATKPRAVVFHARAGACSGVQSSATSIVRAGRVLDRIGHGLLGDAQEVVLHVRRQAGGAAVELELQPDVLRLGQLPARLARRRRRGRSWRPARSAGRRPTCRASRRHVPASRMISWSVPRARATSAGPTAPASPW